MAGSNLLIIERKIDQLIQMVQQLEQENQLLKTERINWQSERGRLVKQNEMARTKVEAMIERLKSMELD